MRNSLMWGVAGASAAVLAVLLVRGAPPVGTGTEGTTGMGQDLQRPSGPPIRSAASGPTRPAEGPATRSGNAPVQVEIDGIDGVLPGVGVDHDFSIEEQSGRRQPQATVTVNRLPDDHTATLLGRHVTGRTVRWVTIKTKDAERRLPEFTLRLENVVLEAIRTHAADGVYLEAVTFRFGKIRLTDADGGSFSWDYAAMRPF